MGAHLVSINSPSTQLVVFGLTALDPTASGKHFCILKIYTKYTNNIVLVYFSVINKDVIEIIHLLKY